MSFSKMCPCSSFMMTGFNSLGLSISLVALNIRWLSGALFISDVSASKSLFVLIFICVLICLSIELRSCLLRVSCVASLVLLISNLICFCLCESLSIIEQYLVFCGVEDAGMICFAVSVKLVINAVNVDEALAGVIVVARPS